MSLKEILNVVDFQLELVDLARKTIPNTIPLLTVWAFDAQLDEWMDAFLMITPNHQNILSEVVIFFQSVSQRWFFVNSKLPTDSLQPHVKT